MPNIRINLDHTPYNGERIVFKAPCDAADVTGLKIYYSSTSDTYTFRDANDNNIGSIGNLFAENALVTIILDTDYKKAFIQNADTNTYLENKFNTKSNKPSYVTATMASATWRNGTYSFESTYPVASYDISIGIAPTATGTQYDAFAKARICGSHNSNIVTALGTVPTVDIPIIIKVVVK